MAPKPLEDSAGTEYHTKVINADCSRSVPPSELRRCVKVEVVVLGTPSLIVLMVSVDVKQH